MPNYDYMCCNEHHQEYRCSISDKPATLPCPECDQPAKSVILAAPHVWKNLYVFDYPGSKAFKAGYVYSHGDVGVQKVSSGPGGMLNPKTRDLHPLAHGMQPEWVKKSPE